MPAALAVAAGAALSSPLAAQAAVTPSLKNLINSVIAGVCTLRSSLLLVPAAICSSVWTMDVMHCACLCHLERHESCSRPAAGVA